MIEVSRQIIEYTPDQMTQNLTVTNKGQLPILYKVRTNNVKAIDARPNTGSIQPKQNIKISIKRNEHVDQNVKLQFTYTECRQATTNETTKENFKQLWAKYDKNAISKQFPIRIAGKTEQKKQQRKQIQKYQTIVSESDPSLFQSVRVSKTSRVEDQQKQVNAQENRQKDSTLQRKLEQLQQQNKILQKKLNERQSESKRGSESNKQLEIDKYLNAPSCRKYHLSKPLLLIIAILFFVIGYYFGSPKALAAPAGLPTSQS